MTDPLRLFPDDGETRPPGVPDNAVPAPSDFRLYKCPRCGQHRLDWMSLTYAACERRQCGYTWRRSGQLHHSEPFPDGF